MTASNGKCLDWSLGGGGEERIDCKKGGGRDLSGENVLEKDWELVEGFGLV